ncbi:hypothetical protein [Pseudomonas sp. R5(2019)]|uniref:hypothetical protein n=1 Tax=Pseudomonas sp. R5(2019) TaxID=2697566 RepID=UPI001412B448|nr:hypothetical protein [Pseudomonas sp. R5(2019)]NBA93673.1 hypothetical protein [Pseudomonas sp. R5(2019)]
MPHIPLSLTATENPVLFINPDASIADLHACASERLRAAKGLIDTLDCLSMQNVDESDVAHLMRAASVLMQEGYEVLKVAEGKAASSRR